MTPVEWLKTVVESMNSRQSKTRYMVVGIPTKDSVRIWNIEDDVVWTFQASSETPLPAKLEGPCCLQKAFKYPSHSADCPIDRPRRQAEDNAKARAYLEQRKLFRGTCGQGECNLYTGHTGPHRAPCGCLNGCKATKCPNV